MPTRLGCIACAVAWYGAGGVTVGDLLGTTCLRGVIARREAAVEGSFRLIGSLTVAEVLTLGSHRRWCIRRLFAVGLESQGRCGFECALVRGQHL